MSKYKRAIICEELVELTEDTLGAILLRQFIYWSTRVQDFDEYLEEIIYRKEYFTEGDRAKDETLFQNGWIYKRTQQLKEEIMVKDSIPTLRRRIKTLLDRGWIQERQNINNRWDQTKQYWVNFVQIETDLQPLGYSLQTVMGEEYGKIKKVIDEMLWGKETARRSETKPKASRKSPTETQPSINKGRHGEHREDKSTADPSPHTAQSPDVNPSPSSLPFPSSSYNGHIINSHPPTSVVVMSPLITPYSSPHQNYQHHQSNVEPQALDSPQHNKPQEHSVISSDQSPEIVRQEKPPLPWEQPLTKDEEIAFFQQVVCWKCAEDTQMTESRAQAITQAIINRFHKKEQTARDKMVVMKFRQGELEKYLDYYGLSPEEIKQKSIQKRVAQAVQECNNSYPHSSP